MRKGKCRGVALMTFFFQSEGGTREGGSPAVQPTSTPSELIDARLPMALVVNRWR